MVRISKQSRRRCSKSGERHGCYLVSEPTPGGVLPVIVLVDPPIPFRPPADKLLGRQPIEINLDLLLEGEPYEKFIAGASKTRWNKEQDDEPELSAFGMSLEFRRSHGVCRTDGLAALSRVRPGNIRSTGYHIRELARATSDRETAKALVCFSQGNWLGVLAAIHRGWKKFDAEKRKRIAPYVYPVLISIGAAEDALLLT